MGQDHSHSKWICDVKQDRANVEFASCNTPVQHACDHRNWSPSPACCMVEHPGDWFYDNDMDSVSGGEILWAAPPPMPADTFTMETSVALCALYEATKSKSSSTLQSGEVTGELDASTDDSNQSVAENEDEATPSKSSGSLHSGDTDSIQRCLHQRLKADVSTNDCNQSPPKYDHEVDGSTYSSEAVSERSVWGLMKDSKSVTPKHSDALPQDMPLATMMNLHDLVADARLSADWPPPPPSETLPSSELPSDAFSDVDDSEAGDFPLLGIEDLVAHLGKVGDNDKAMCQIPGGPGTTWI